MRNLFFPRVFRASEFELESSELKELESSEHDEKLAVIHRESYAETSAEHALESPPSFAGSRRRAIERATQNSVFLI